MADTQHEQGRGREEKHEQAAPPPAQAPGAGLIEVQHAATPQEIAAIMRRHPEERDAIIMWLHQHRGNAFAQQVTEQLGVIERNLPAGVDLKSVQGTVTIPGKKKLTGDWASSVATRHATQLTVEVSQTGVRAWMSPSLFVDATWPLQNAELRGAGVHFADGKAYADVEDGHGFGSGLISIKDKVASKVTGIIDKGIAGTPFARPGYKPVQDADLGGTLDKVVHGFTGMFAGDHAGDDHEPAQKPPALGPQDFQRVSGGATITAKAGGSFGKAGTGLVIAPGSDVGLFVDGAANAEQLSHAHTPGEAAQIASIQGLTVTATGMEVQAKGKPVAKISSLTIKPGGEVSIGHMELLGKARDAQVTESGISLLIGLMALAGHDPSAGDLVRNAQDPTIVDGVTRSMMEKEFTDTVRKLVIQYRSAVPGMDLAKVLGIPG